MKKYIIAFIFLVSFSFQVTQIQANTLLPKQKNAILSFSKQKNTKENETNIFNLSSQISAIEKKILKIQNTIEFDNKKLSEEQNTEYDIGEIYLKILRDIGEIKNLQNTETEDIDKKNAITIEVNNRKIETSNDLVSLYTKLWVSKKTWNPTIDDILKETKSLKSLYEKHLVDIKAKQNALTKNIEEKTKELQSLKMNLERQRSNLSNLLMSLFFRFLRFFVIVLFLIISSKLFRLWIRKKYYLTEEKNNVLISLIKWFFNIAIFITIIIFFFSEFTNFLPFLAIFSTAIGFALRDVISSIIAFFILWINDSIYKVWDLIKIENPQILWVVKEIRPTVTVLDELWMSWKTWSQKTFPNKYIFEKSINNRSKFWAKRYIAIEFMFSVHTNFEKLEQIIKQTISDFYKDFWEITNKKIIELWITDDGYDLDSFAPKIFYANLENGVRVRIKKLVLLQEIIYVKSTLTKNIIKNIQNEKDIEVVYAKVL